MKNLDLLNGKQLNQSGGNNFKLKLYTVYFYYNILGWRKTMKIFLTIAALGILAGCADKDEDTGSDTADVVDTGDSSEE